MPFPISVVGRSTAPVTHEVDTAWLRAFDGAVAHRGRLGHPLFPVCVEWPAVTAAARLDDGTLLPDERRRGVHATHDLTIHRPIEPGDIVTTTATIDALESRARGTLERVRLETRDARGALLATTLMGSMFVGVEVSGAASRANEAPRRTSSDSALPDATIAIAVGADQGREYSQASRIWNPIHTDHAAAVAAGLPAPILHGTCTLALAISAVLEWAGNGQEHPVQRLRARFSGMVMMPSALELHIWRPAGDELRFEVVDADRAPVIRDGSVSS